MAIFMNEVNKDRHPALYAIEKLYFNKMSFKNDFFFYKIF